MDVSQCFKVDAGLKSLKLLSRRLHTLLDTHATELQILQRLYYKNKNQHRGSLFWRNVVEIRRYSERFEQHKPHILIDDFRCAFYGPGIHKYGSSNHCLSSCCFHISYAVQILWKVRGPTFRMQTTFPLPRTRLRTLFSYLRRWFWLYRPSKVLKFWWCIDMSSMPESLHASLIFYLDINIYWSHDQQVLSSFHAVSSILTNLFDVHRHIFPHACAMLRITKCSAASCL